MLNSQPVNRLTIDTKLNFNEVNNMTIFDEQIQKAKELSGYNKQRASQLLDDLATAYISNEFKTLDKSYYAVKSIRKSLRSQGYTLAEINDYLLEYSYITKTQINKLRNKSIYMNDSISIAPQIENIVDKHNTRTTTDIIIDKLKTNNDLLLCLKNGVARKTIEDRFKLNNTTLLINFYTQHKDIIDN